MLADNRARGISDEQRKNIAEKLRTGQNVQCLECGEDFYRKKSDAARRKFCKKVCYRTYLAKRFDRWIANPEGLALPQCYDEFLDGEELRCVVEGCDWVGLHLSAHMNLAHGVRAQEFKRAAGFNLSTGVVARPVAEAMQTRRRVGVAASNGPQLNALAVALSRAAVQAPNYVQYRSLEAAEHHHKARALGLQQPGPSRACRGCGEPFQQATHFGKTVYCSVACRARHYRSGKPAARPAKAPDQAGK
jgi:hypothetical protein